MQPTDLLRQTDDAGERAVSPVIGVILMVAITVILAAIIGTFVLGVGEQVQTTSPQASFTFTYDGGVTGADCGLGTDGQLDIAHDGGDTISPAQVSVMDGDGSVPWDDTSDGSCAATPDDVTAGSTMTVDVDTTDTIRVVWQDGDQSATLASWDGPDA